MGGVVGSGCNQKSLESGLTMGIDDREGVRRLRKEVLVYRSVIAGFHPRSFWGVRSDVGIWIGNFRTFVRFFR